MSLKCEKHAILIFMVLLMLMVIPMSFASDVNDTGIQSVSADDAIVAAPVYDVNTSVSASVDADDIVDASSDFVAAPDSNIYVNGSVPTTGTGTEDSPFKTIGEAITKANNMDESTINIASGTYTEHDLILNKASTIIGSGIDEVIVDAGKSGHIFDIRGTNIEVVFKNMTLQNADVSTRTQADRFGGAIKAGFPGTTTTAYSVMNLTLDSVKFINNSAYQGGAVYISRGAGSGFPLNTLNVNNCEFIGNNASYYGGAIATLAISNIENSNFTNNKLYSTVTGQGSLYGGALYIANSYTSNSRGEKTLDITGCIFENNTATGRGGAMYINTGSTTTDYASRETALINYNIFVSNGANYTTGSGSSIKIYDNNQGRGIHFGSAKALVDLNNNWWGYNDVNFTYEFSSDSFVPTKYAQLTLTANPEEITTADTSAVSTSFKWNDDTAADIDKLPVRAVEYTSNGTLTASEGNVGLESTFYASEAGIYYVNASVDNQRLSENIEVLESSNKWYVNGSVETSGNGKSRETAFKTVKEATDAAGDEDTIYILEGKYTITETIRITGTDSKSLTIVGEGDVKITGSTNIFNLGGSKTYTFQGLTFDGVTRDQYGVATVNGATRATKINLIDCNFINNAGGTIVRIAGESSIIRCNFINNIATGNTLSPVNVAKGVIDYYEGSALTVNYCNFINNDYSVSGVLIYSGGTAGNVDNNFWGSNDRPSQDAYSSEKLTLNNYVIINATINNETINKDNNYILNFKFQSTTDGDTYTNLEDIMPTVTFDLVSILGNGLSSDSITMINNEATTTYSATNNGGEVIEINYVYNVAELSFVVRPDNVIFEVEDMEMTYGDDGSLNVSVKDSKGESVEVPVAVNINGEDKDPITSTGGKITFNDLKDWAAGNYIINLTVNTADYKGNKTVNVKINKATPNFNVPENISLDVDAGEFISVTDLVPSDAVLSYSSNDTNVATVDNTGNVTGKGEGSAIITISIAETQNYTAFSKNLTVTVSRLPTEINCTSDSISIKYGGKLKTGEFGDWNAVIKCNGTTVSANVDIDVNDSDIVSYNGTESYFEGLKVGTTTVNVSYAGDYKYAPSYKIITVTVTPVDASVSVVNDSLELDVDATGNIVANTNPSGLNVTYESNDTSVAIVDTNGVVTAKGVGVATIIVTINDTNYFANSTAVTVTVNEKPVPSKENLTISASANPITVGENATVVVTGFEDATGNVTAKVGDGVYTVPIVGGTATFTIPGLTENATAVISYPGDGKYNNASATVDIVVNPKEKENATIVIDAPSEATVGDNVTVTVTLPDDATGNVTIGNEVVPVEEGTASAVLTNVPAGNNTVPITYSGDDKYNSIETSVTINVNEKPVPSKENLTISASADPITVGENATVVVTGFEDATGNVTAKVGDGVYTVPIVGGTATFTIPGLTENATAVISYPGDGKYNNASATVDIVVNPKEKENATIVIDAPSEATVGDNVTVTVTLPDDATGNVTIGNEVVPVEEGTASAVLTNVPAGNNTVPITYSGDDKYNSIETSVNVMVNPQPVPPKEDLNASVVVDPITVGEDAVIVVSDLKDATGTVSAVVNGKTYTAPIKEGKATINVPGLTENATALISYPGDDKYNRFTERANIVVNPKEKENATITIDVPPVTEGQNAIVKVELPKDATGNVTAAVGDKTYTAPVKDGKATITIPDLAAGNYTVPVTYSGDDKYNPLTEEIKIAVDEDKSDIIKAPDVTKYFNGPERFVVTVTDYQGKPLVNKSVTIVINGVTYNRKTNVNGTTTMALGLNSGVYNATVTVDNKSINSVVTILTTVNGTDITKIFRNGTQYYATFRDSEGNYLKEGETVRFNINGVMYDRKVSGDKGLAKLNINLEAGKYIITAMNLITGDKSSNTITVLSRITENADLIKYFRNASQYTVKIIGDDGKAVGAGENVTFNINGVLYTRQTDANGIAKLNINLEAGDYIITAEYKDCRVSNNIKVLSVLTAEDISMKYRDGTQFKANLVDGRGKPYFGQSVTFNVNGVFYNRATDSTGQARLNINLMPGEYIITSSYNGCNIANTIKISA